MKRELHFVSDDIHFERRTGWLTCTCGKPFPEQEHEELREAHRLHRREMGLKSESHAHRLGEYDDTAVWTRRSRVDWQRKGTEHLRGKR